MTERFIQHEAPESAKLDEGIFSSSLEHAFHGAPTGHISQMIRRNINIFIRVDDR